MNQYDEAIKILAGRFSGDHLISVATVEGTRPYVRTVNAYYEEGAFYIVTYTLSNKMKQIENMPEVAVCGEWFTAHGIGEKLGYVRNECNDEIMARIRNALSEWYGNGQVDENDGHTSLLRIRLTDGVLFHEGTRYVLEFKNQTGTV